MNRFIVHPFVWHDDIRTNQAVVFTQPRSVAGLEGLLSGGPRDGPQYGLGANPEMQPLLLFVLVVTQIAGCASEYRLPDDLTTQATPVEWTGPSRVLFKVFDSRRKPLGTFTLELTDEPAKTCIVGEWRKARPIATDLAVIDLSKWWADPELQPSYAIEGRLLMVQLNGGRICDAYTEVQVELLGQGGHGLLQPGGIVRGPTYGMVFVERLP